MVYVPRQEQVEHFWEAIPYPQQTPLSANQIFNRQQKMRLPRVQVYEYLERFVRQGQVEGISAGYMRYYRKFSDVVLGGIASEGVPSYNDRMRSKSSPEKANSFVQALAPLSTGKPVVLWMDHPRKTNRKHVVLLVPGPVAGLPKGTVLVCVIGSGSCIVRVDRPTKIADLVLAGIPAKLATTLMDTVHRVLKD